MPERLPSNSVAVDVKHIDPSPDVRRTVELARDGSGGRDGGGRASPWRLDVTIDAPRQIFVRGRGLDAELGGRLRVTGPVSAIVADGAFQMRRGRLDLFTQRVTFDRGIITFAGDLDPILDFSGSTESTDVTVTVTVTGPATDPNIQFSSVPELPQDEVLAHLIFNKGITDLSPVQIARLAQRRGRRGARPAAQVDRPRRPRHRHRRRGRRGAGRRPLHQRERLCRRAAGRDVGIDARDDRPRHHPRPQEPAPPSLAEHGRFRASGYFYRARILAGSRHWDDSRSSTPNKSCSSPLPRGRRSP